MAALFQLSSEDAVAWLAGLPAGTAPLVVLDPGVPGRARRGKKGEPSTPAFPEARLPTLLYEVHRVLAKDGLCWWLTEPAQAFKAARVAERLGLAIGAPLVWDRGDGSGARIAFALPLSRSRARSPGAEVVQAHRSEDAPATLPELLCRALIEAGSEPGQLVLDPFMGSGALGAAALALDRGYLGNDAIAATPALHARLAKLGEAWQGAGSPLAEAPVIKRNGAHPPLDALGIYGQPGSARPSLGMAPASQLTMFVDGAELR